MLAVRYSTYLSGTLEDCLFEIADEKVAQEWMWADKSTQLIAASKGPEEVGVSVSMDNSCAGK